MASSGIAALLLDNGRTAHFKLKIPLKCNEQTNCNININTDIAKLIQRAKVFICDQAPMLEKNVYETVDRTFRDIMKIIDSDLENIPFGGKIMVFGGDFRQILPVITHANRATIVSKYINRSYLWKHMNILKLTINKRINLSDEINSENQKDFAEYLLRIGEGSEPIFKELGDDVIKLSEDFCIPYTSINDLISIIYNDFNHNYTNTKYLIDRAILTTTNQTVDKINEEILNLLPTDEMIYYSADSATDPEKLYLQPTEFLNTLN